jgi:hypothetical protein
VKMGFNELVQQAKTSSARVKKLEDIYEGKVRLESLGVSLPPQVRLLEMVSPFPKLAVDVLTEVLCPEGYILATAQGEEIAALLRRWWQANNLDSQVRQACSEALVQGISYWIVGPGTGDIPRVTAHTRLGVAIGRDHMGRVSEGIRLYKYQDAQYATYYEPGVTSYWVLQPAGRWVQVDAIETGVDRPLIVPMVNAMRLNDLDGRSEIDELVTISDAASRSLTNLQIAQEMLSMPLRYILGKGAKEALAGVNKIEAYFDSFLTGPQGATVGQLTGADLNPIISTYKLYAQQISAITGIPPSMLGISTDNPASAEAMRVAKERLITRAETKQELFGDALEEVARLQLAVMGKKYEGLETLEMQWRDPATPSQSAVIASALQAQAQGVISAETAREFMRLTPEQKAREKAENDLVTY